MPSSRARKPRITASTRYEDLPEFLTTDETRIYLCCSKAYVFEAIRRGDIPARKLGSKNLLIPKRFFDPTNTLNTVRRDSTLVRDLLKVIKSHDGDDASAGASPAEARA
jgi:hypothetical protein